MRIVDCHRIVFLGGFPCGSAGKESTCNAGSLGSIPGLGRSPGEERLPTPVFWTGEFHGPYSSWGHKELDTTEQHSHRTVFTDYQFCVISPMNRFHTKGEDKNRSKKSSKFSSSSGSFSTDNNILLKSFY